MEEDFNAVELLCDLEESDFLKKIQEESFLAKLEEIPEPKNTKSFSCKKCGKEELFWYEHPGTSRRLLEISTGNPHFCEQYLFKHKIHKEQIKEILFGKEKVRCKFCRKDGLYWIENSERDWRLYDRNLKLHECEEFLNRHQE